MADIPKSTISEDLTNSKNPRDGEDLFQAWDIPVTERTGDKNADKRRSLYGTQLKQAVSRGLVSPQEANEIWSQGTTDQRFFSERILGFEASGSRIQAVADVLMLGNYLTASLAQARKAGVDQRRAEGIDPLNPMDWLNADWADIDGNGPITFKPLGSSFFPAFSTSEFQRSWSQRTTFGDVLGTGYDTVGGFTTSLIADIALDPTTYLTFGMGAGAKIVASRAAVNRIAAKSGNDAVKRIAQKEGKVTLTRWGEKVYREATRDLLPKLEKEIMKTNPTAKWGDAAMRTRFSNEVFEHMIENYGRLAPAAAKHDAILAGKLGRRTGLREAAPEWRNMFKETADLTHKEIGVGSLGISSIVRKTIAKEDSFMESAFRAFNKTYGLDYATKVAYETQLDALKVAKRNSLKGIEKAFKGVSAEEREQVTKLIEMKFADDTASNSVGVIPVEYSAKVQGLALKAEQIFQDILIEEQKHGLIYDGVEGYVSHMFNGDLGKVEAFMSIAKKYGVRSGTYDNPFAKHRGISTIETINEMFGKGTVMTDIGQILAKRKSFSLEMIYKQRFYDEVAATKGVPAALISAAESSVPEAISSFLRSNRESIADIANLSQFWTKGSVDVRKWGFRKKKSVENLDVIKWMTTKVGERDMKRGFVTDNLANWGKQLDPIIETTKRAAKQQFNINEVLAGLYNGDVMGRLEYSQLQKVLKNFDDRTRKAGIGPLKALFPDIVDKVRAANPKHRVKNKVLDEYLSRPVEGLTKSTFLSEEMLLRAQNARLSMGILTDIEKPLGILITDVSKRLNRLGFRPEETSQLLEAMFDKKSLAKLTAGEMDALDYFLIMRTDPKARVFNETYLAGEQMIKVDFARPKGERLAPVATNLKDQIIKLKDERKSVKEALDKVSEPLIEINERVSRLRFYKMELARLRKIQKNTKLSKAERGEATKKIAEILNDSGSNKYIDAELTKLKNKSAKMSKKAQSLRSKDQYYSAWSSFIKKQDQVMRRPTEKNLTELETLRKKLKNLAKKHKMKFPQELQKISRPYAKRPPKDARFSDELYTPGTETIGFESGKLKTDRDYGTVGANIEQVGEYADYIPTSAYYLPKSIASIIKEINTPLYNPEAPKFVNTLLRGYDYIQNLYKAPLMAPFAEFFKRNAITNIALAHLKAGVSILDPINMSAYSRSILYAIGRESIDLRNLPKASSAALGIVGAGTGALAGGAGAALDDDPGTGVMAGAGMGALAGALAGVGVGAAGGAAVRKDLIGVKEGSLPLGTVAGFAGGIYGGSEEGVAGAAAGAGLGYGAGRVAGRVGAELAGAATKAAEGTFLRNAINLPANDFDKLAKSKIEVGGKQFTVEEWVKEAAKRGVFNTHVEEEVFRQAGSIPKFMASKNPEELAAAIAPGSSLFMRDMFRAGELASEIPTRLMLFTTVARQSGSLGVAARAVKDYLFDYASLSNWERRAVKRAMPFYSWSKHAATVTYDSLVNNTGRVAAQMKFFTTMSKDEDYDPADIPDWLRNRLHNIKVIASGDGDKEIVAKTGYGLAIEDTVELAGQMLDFGAAFNPWSRQSKEERIKKGVKLLTRGPMGLTTAVEWATNMDFFRGGSIEPTADDRSAFQSGRPYDTAPKWLQRAVGYRVNDEGKSSVDPRFAYLMQEIPSSRFLSIARKVHDSETGEFNWFALARQVLGNKIYRYGPDQRLYYDRAKLDRMAYLLSQIKNRKGDPIIQSVKIEYATEKTPKVKVKKKGTRFSY